MGRTVPSFRLASVEEEREWKVFRNAIDKSDRKIFDEMFSISRLYNSVCFYAASPIRIRPIFMSIIFHHYKKLMRLFKQIKKDEMYFQFNLFKVLIVNFCDKNYTLHGICF
ncbi:MAG: hypothetical protein WCF23_10345 [Candidatus Nitrosopolaris sp.]